MKKIIISVIVLSLIIPALAQGLAVSFSDSSGSKGDTVKIPIHLEGASNVGAMDILLNYDKAILKAMSIEAGELGKNALMESNTSDNGEVRIVLADAQGINGKGSIAVISFEVIGDVGSTSKLSLDRILVSNLDLVDVIVTTNDGTFSVTEKAFPLFYIILIIAIIAIIAVIIVVKRRK
jgi:hypothetical protein